MDKVHLDTSFVQPLIQRKNMNEYRYCNRVITKAQESYKIVVSQVVIGELIATLFRGITSNEKGRIIASLITELERLMGENLDGLMPVSRAVLEISQEVMKRDSNLDPTDVLIVSQALADPESYALLTRDRKILRSTGLTSLEEELRNENRRNVRLYLSEGL